VLVLADFDTYPRKTIGRLSHTRTLASRGAVSAAVGALALCVTVGGCGSSTHKRTAKPVATPKPVATLNTRTVAEAIVQSIQKEKHLTATVSCPPNIPQKKGYGFTCVATTYASAHGKKTAVHTAFTVKQINDLGNVYYSSPR
jgi:hypothetical protein